MKVMSFRAVAPNLDKVPHSNDFFDTVKFRYHEYAAEGLFQPTEPEAMYIYQIKDVNGVKRTGLVLATDIEEYFNGSMRPHEKTIVNNEDLQAQLLHTRGAAIKPILLMHSPIEELTELIDNYIEKHKKFYVIELGKEKHRFWQITEGLIQKKIRQIFETKVPYAYIADGHHRSASFAALHKSQPTSKTNRMLTAYFSENQLSVHAFNRVITDLNGLTTDQFLEELMKIFKIKINRDFQQPYAKNEMTMFLEGKWFQLIVRKDVLKHFAEGLVLLDVHFLNEKVLKPLLGITNIRTDNRLKYIDSQQDIGKLKDAVGTEGVGFCLFPIDLGDMKMVVDSQGVLPPKSTFFEPRMKNGLLVYEI
ncbi:MAG: DUF1015 domain-containing protein [Saprospiraceae bacterium]|nr:DUF1015 domain-containing protein [Saprospiraceae bacterium]